MDIHLAQTFLQIVRTGSFVAAAEKMHITQTAVTARIKNLERDLGCRLFVRNRAGAMLTADGQRFVEHAAKLVQTWQAAKRDLPLPSGTERVLNIGAELSLWNPLMLQWLDDLLPTSNLAIRAEVGERNTLMEKLEHGVLDIIIAHQPEYWPGVQVELLLEEKLIFVYSSKTSTPYIFVDWGAYFRQQHDAALPDHARSRLCIDFGPLALHYLLNNGGSGYFRTRVAEPYLATGQLLHDRHYPEFTFSIYVLYRKADKDRFSETVASLAEVCKTETSWLN